MVLMSSIVTKMGKFTVTVVVLVASAFGID